MKGHEVNTPARMKPVELHIHTVYVMRYNVAKQKLVTFLWINLGKRVLEGEYCQSIPMGKERKEPETANIKPRLVKSKEGTNRCITSNLYCSAKRTESDRM